MAAARVARLRLHALAPVRGDAQDAAKEGANDASSHRPTTAGSAAPRQLAGEETTWDATAAAAPAAPSARSGAGELELALALRRTPKRERRFSFDLRGPRSAPVEDALDATLVELCRRTETHVAAWRRRRDVDGAFSAQNNAVRAEARRVHLLLRRSRLRDLLEQCARDGVAEALPRRQLRLQLLPTAAGGAEQEAEALAAGLAELQRALGHLSHLRSADVADAANAAAAWWAARGREGERLSGGELARARWKLLREHLGAAVAVEKGLVARRQLHYQARAGADAEVTRGRLRALRAEALAAARRGSEGALGESAFARVQRRARTRRRFGGGGCEAAELQGAREAARLQADLSRAVTFALNAGTAAARSAAPPPPLSPLSLPQQQTASHGPPTACDPSHAPPAEAKCDEKQPLRPDEEDNPQDGPQHAPAAALAVSPRRPRPRVLVVDSDASRLSRAEAVLRPQGFSVAGAIDPADAVAALRRLPRQERPHILLIDARVSYSARSDAAARADAAAADVAALRALRLAQGGNTAGDETGDGGGNLGVADLLFELRADAEVASSCVLAVIGPPHTARLDPFSPLHPTRVADAAEPPKTPTPQPSPPRLRRPSGAPLFAQPTPQQQQQQPQQAPQLAPPPSPHGAQAPPSPSSTQVRRLRRAMSDAERANELETRCLRMGADCVLHDSLFVSAHAALIGARLRAAVAARVAPSLPHACSELAASPLALLAPRFEAVWRAQGVTGEQRAERLARYSGGAGPARLRRTLALWEALASEAGRGEEGRRLASELRVLADDVFVRNGVPVLSW
jgi:hypothetical protein